MHVPQAEAAFVEKRKIRDYLLSPSHPQDSGKAAFFQLFGFGAAQWEVMRDALTWHPVANVVSKVTQSPHGTKYEVRCSTTSPDGRNPCITTVWIVEGARSPRLVTAFPGQPE